jgi:lauroyl/myristoyl acyltransferase
MQLFLLNLLDVISPLPLKVRYGITNIFAVLAYLLFSGKRNIVRKNISTIRNTSVSEKDVREVFRSYGRYWAELPVVGQVWKSECNVICGPDFPPSEPCFLGVTFHIGNFELFGPALFEYTGRELHVIAERLYPQSLFDRFFKIRKRHHIHTIAHDDARGIIDVLRRGKPLGVVCDRSVNGKGDEILLFGKKWVMPLSIIRYALSIKIPVYYSYCISDEGILQLFCKRSVGTESFENVILEITEMLETALCRYPLQWHNVSVGLEDEKMDIGTRLFQKKHNINTS